MTDKRIETVEFQSGARIAVAAWREAVLARAKREAGL